MALIRLHKNPLNGKCDIVYADGNLLDIMAREASWAAHGAIIKRNGEIIANSAQHDDMDERCNLELCKFDSVDVYALPESDPLSWWQIVLIVVGALAVSIALMPRPRLPNEDGGKTGQNNQLNAANNAFRPREAIPDIAGEIVSFPDFIQRSYYEYVANKRVFTEVFCVGVGYFDLMWFKDGETNFDDISTSSVEVFEPFDTVDGLLDVRTAEGSEELPLPATDDDSRSGTITNGSFLTSSQIDLGDGAETLINDLGLEVGQSITLNVWYTFEGSDTQLIEDFGITNISGGTLTLTPATLPMEDGGTVYGSLIQTAGGVVGRWFTLAGNAISEIRWQVKMPQGIRKGDGTNGVVNYILEYQEIDSNGDPIGTPSGVAGTFSGSTQEQQYATRKVSVTPSRYRAKATRTSASLGDNSADLLVLERIESVTPYSGSGFGEVTIIRTTRATAPQQNRGASNKISTLARRKLQLFDPDTGTFAATYTHTRSFAQYIMYVLVKLAKVELSNINYQQLFEIEDSLDYAELGYFDFSFDDFDIGFKDRLQTALNTARCYYYMVGNKFNFGRDEERSQRVQLFNIRNTVPEQSEQGFSFYRDGEFDSIELQYVDPVTNTDAYIRKRINPTTAAIESGLGESVYEYKLNGCRNYYQALNRAELEIRKILYSWRVVKDTVGAEALSIGVGQRVGWCDINEEDVFNGEVLDQIGDTFTTSEPWTPDGVSTYYVYIVASDGNVSNSVVCTQPSGQPYKFTASGLTASLPDGYEIQRGSLYMIAPLTDLAARDYILTKRDKPNERGECRIEMINYDDRMYDGDDILPPAGAISLSASAASGSIENESCAAVNGVSSTVTATGGNGTFTFAWTKLSGSGTIASGAATATLTVNFASVCPEETLTGTYRCTVTSGDETATIDVVFSATNTAEDPTPVPLSASGFGGSNAVFNASCVNIVSTGSVVASGGTGSYTYSWAKISGEGSISAGSTTDTMSVLFTSVCPEGFKSGLYRCTVSDGVDSVTVDITYTAENLSPIG